MSVKQLSVFLENRAGQLAEITALLSKKGVDLRAINIAETADYGVMRIIADDARLAASVLSENGFILSVNEVTAVTVPDEKGALSRVLDLLAANGVDVEYMYSVFSRKNGSASMIFRVNDNEKLVEILKANGIGTADAKDLEIN